MNYDQLPQIKFLLLHSPFDNESSERASNPIPQPLSLYLSGSAFLVNYTVPNKQPPGVKSVFKSFDHISSL